jgi:hypothetical protein
MRFNDRLVYSKLVFLQRKNKGASFKKLRRETGLNLQRTIPRIVQRLVSWGLAEEQGGKWWAKEPPVPDWFGWVRDQDRPWFERLAYWWLYLPGPGLKLTEAAVWSLLWSFQQTGRKLRIGKLHLLLKLDSKTVRKAVYRLRDRGLLKDMTPIIPDQNLRLFRDRATATYRLSRMWTLPTSPNLQARLVAALDGTGQAMLKAGWRRQEITDYCQAVADKLASEPDAVLYRLLLDLPKLFQKTQEQHEANVAAGKVKHARNCRGLIQVVTEREIIKRVKAYKKMPVECRGLYLDVA